MGSVLSPGDYYRWPHLRQTSHRIEGEVRERMDSDGRFTFFIPSVVA